ncbi:MAG: putative zinc-binding metallopeptidase [Phycisphaeraceae bacterium]
MPPRATTAPKPRWAKLSDEALLDVRFRDLGLSLERCPAVLEDVDRLNRELASAGLSRFRPHCWLSSEWFSPDGVPGIAIPFYLAHPRLMRLEKAQMLAVEGGTPRQRMMILRHEAGHAVCNAYRLHRRKRFRALFGSASEPYPESYKPDPASRKHVTHLPAWYAQAHPAEDFAETFAVWLTPGGRWHRTYASWPVAMRKLMFIDDAVAELGGVAPPVRTRRKVEPVSSLNTTLREHYRKKRWFYGDTFPDFYDRDLLKLFSADPKFAHRPTAAATLRSFQKELRETVARWTGTHAYTIDQVLRDMIDRCKELKLRLAVPVHQARREATLMVTVQTMNYIHAGHHPVAL